VKRIFKSWEPRAIGSLCVIAGCVWLFIQIADEVIEGETHAVDIRILRSLRSATDPEILQGPRWMRETMRDLTALGGYPILTLATLGVAGFLFLSRHSRDARFVLTAVVGGWILAYGLKFGFDRPRPDIVPHYSDVYSSSFPSGHSLMSAVVYLTLGSLLTNMVTSTRLKCYFLGIAVLLAFLVGVSRVALGVHYPTDVLAGWCLGLAWAEVCWLIHHRLQLRRVELPLDSASTGDPRV
jgi:undecaprenyl-diphosphatase